MKKPFAVVMAAMMVAGMMAGCSSKPQETTAAATETETIGNHCSRDRGREQSRGKGRPWRAEYSGCGGSKLKERI